ncbi:MAG TPA: YcxB family protein [Planococcus sp. (in: firmicutes)]|nr:YcxB family protein [Planococcus sp. (in: firmicutes)]
MKIDYNVTEEAFVEFNVFHAKNSKAIRKSMTIQRFLVPIIYLLVGVIFSFILDVPVLFLVIPFLILGILWIIFFPAYFNRQIKRTAKKMIREGKNEGVLGKHSMSFTGEGLREIGARGETTVSWSGIENLKEDQCNFYVYNSGVTAFIVPKKDLINIEEVRSLLQNKISQQA